ncbi:phospholipase A2 inhibitor and Ly6/PLAUR domain-containing protein-like [Ascaphus truei]|uniref:phospholipase A2 inhibitor and Ly6/PLAUR domain-containing protein-like n=1 Tax=Ascaphus truei TaxID=8439 RepID=UPI003F59362A
MLAKVEVKDSCSAWVLIGDLQVFLRIRGNRDPVSSSRSQLCDTMRLFLSIICIFSASITAGTGLQCQDCQNYASTDCTGSLAVCSGSATSCMAAVTVITSDNLSSSSIVKSCASYPQLCGVFYSITMGPIHLASKTECCATDGCNSGTPQLPPRDLTPNGVQCPFCIAEASSCTSTGNIDCTGSETRCITYSGGIYNGTQFEQKAFKGCTTENVCNVPAPPYPATLLQQGYQLSCTPGATH